MKRILLLSTLILGITVNSGAQISLNGVITVQNSKVNTGKTERVSNAQVSSQNAQPNTTDIEGKFLLRFTGMESGKQVQITVTPYGAYKDYVVVNEWDLNQTLGRKSVVGIYIAKQTDLDARKAEMVGINMKKYEERAERTIKRLQTELEVYKNNSDYMNVRYKEIRDSLQMVNQDISTAYKLIEEYAKSLITINLDEKEDSYVKAYNCFAKGELDSVSYYLKADELDKKYQNLLQLKEESEKEKALAKVLTESASLKEERLVAGMNDLIKEWLLLAQTASLQNKYEETQTYYEKALNADSLHTDNLFEFANYLSSIREYTKAEHYYRKCLETLRALEKETPEQYLHSIAQSLNNLANLHKAIKEYSAAMAEYEEALEIRRKLAERDPEAYLFGNAQTLNNLGSLYTDLKEYPKGLKVCEEALEIFENLAQNDSKVNVSTAQTLNNLAILHFYIGEYENALKEHAKALEIRRALAQENPKLYLADVAQSLNNLAYLHNTIQEYPQATEEYGESMGIYKKLAEENPKAYLPDVAMTLNNLAFLHANINEHRTALEGYYEALAIYRKLTEEHPKAYLLTIAVILQNIVYSHFILEDYSKVLEECSEEALAIYRKFAEENPKTFLFNVGISLLNLAEVYQTFNKYEKSLEVSQEAWDILKNLIEENQTYFPYAMLALNNISGYSLLTKKITQAEQFARQTLEYDDNIFYQINLAHALLLQNRYEEAEPIYRALAQALNENNETYTQTLLDDLEKLEKAGAIPENCKKNVEKIKEMLKNEK